MITKTGVHALLALSALAELPEGEYAGAAEIAGGIGAPPNYLGKLLRVLADQGILESQKGKGGGFRLRRDAARITLLDVMEPIERVSRWSGCFLGKGRCSDRSPCAVHERWKEVREAYIRFLASTTVADLAERSPARTRPRARSGPRSR